MPATAPSRMIPVPQFRAATGSVAAFTRGRRTNPSCFVEARFAAGDLLQPFVGGRENAHTRSPFGSGAVDRLCATASRVSRSLEIVEKHTFRRPSNLGCLEVVVRPARLQVGQRVRRLGKRVAVTTTRSRYERVVMRSGGYAGAGVVSSSRSRSSSSRVESPRCAARSTVLAPASSITNVSRCSSARRGDSIAAHRRRASAPVGATDHASARCRPGPSRTRS
jgi:hypothetical protein